MSLVFERRVVGPAAHALVIGVGGYPFAKPGKSAHGPYTPYELIDLADLLSAPVGAKLFADWLITHSDHLPAPLATVEVALSAPAGVPSEVAEYDWQRRFGSPAGAVDPRNSAAVSSATEQEVLQVGADWAARLRAAPDQTAIFYICGHGVAVPTRSVVFLSNLAGLANSAWHPFIDVQKLANQMARMSEIRSGYLFIDACQEVIDDFVIKQADTTQSIGDGLTFFPPRPPGESNKVLLLVPGPMATKAYDDGLGNGGRYTQILVEALNGAAVRNYSGTGDWGIMVDSLPKAMKALYQLREWPPDGFDPTPITTFISAQPLIRYLTPPAVPFRIQLDPAPAISRATRVWLEDGTKSEILARKSLSEVWTDWVTARMGLCYVTATFPATGTSYQARLTPVDLSEMRVDPILIHRVQP